MMNSIKTYFHQRIHLGLWFGISVYLCLLYIPISRWKDMWIHIIWVFFYLLIFRLWDDLWQYQNDQHKPNRDYTKTNPRKQLWIFWSIVFIIFSGLMFLIHERLAQLILLMTLINGIQYSFAFWKKKVSDALPMTKYAIIGLLLYIGLDDDVSEFPKWKWFILFIVTLVAGRVNQILDRKEDSSKQTAAGILFVFLISIKLLEYVF